MSTLPAKIIVQRYLQKIEEELDMTFRRSSEIFNHPTIKGENAEFALAATLAQILGSRFNVGRGQIMDLEGKVSRQMDIILHDGHTSPLNNGNNEMPSLYFAESVISAIEVKSRFDSSAIDSISRAGANLKELSVTRGHDDIVPYDINKNEAENFYQRVPYSCFAFSTNLKSETILNRLSSQEPGFIDAIFILKHGAYFSLEATERLNLQFGEDGATMGDWKYYPALPLAKPGARKILDKHGNEFHYSSLWYMQVFLELFSPEIIHQKSARLSYYLNGNQNCTRDHPPFVSFNYKLAQFRKS